MGGSGGEGAEGGGGGGGGIQRTVELVQDRRGLRHQRRRLLRVRGGARVRTVQEGQRRGDLEEVEGVVEVVKEVAAVEVAEVAAVEVAAMVEVWRRGWWRW